jgi:hypothetical protein
VSRSLVQERDQPPPPGTLGREPTVDEIACELDVAATRVEAAMRCIRPRSSLEARGRPPGPLHDYGKVEDRLEPPGHLFLGGFFGSRVDVQEAKRMILSMKEARIDAAKITDQFRSRTGFVYDLRCDGSKLTLFIAPTEQPSDAGQWMVEARMSHSPEMLVIAKHGTTRREALRAMAQWWRSKERELGLPKVDWEAVEKALTQVRAL